MSDSFVDGFILNLTPHFSPDQLRIIQDALSVYTLGYEISPIKTEIITCEYQLPQEYYIYMASKAQDGRMSDKSKDQYRMCLEDMLFFLHTPLGKITVNHIRLYLQSISVNKKTGKKLSVETLNQRKSIIKSFFKWLYEEEYIDKDPSVRIKREKSHSRPRTEYADTDIEQIRAACESIRDEAIVDLLASSGIRVSECVGLDRGDIDLDKRELTVYGKGGKWRTAYIDARAVVSLRKYIASRTDECEALFVSKRAPHKRISTSAVRKCLHGLSAGSGVDGIIPHRFRHTMATSAINRGMPIESVQMLLGHSEIETTLRYAHVSNEKVKNDFKKYSR